MSDLRDETRRHIERELYEYPETLRHLAERRALLVDGPLTPRDDADPGRRTALVWSDPTASRAAVLERDQALREMERITSAIDAVYTDLSDPVQWAIGQLYFRRQPQAIVAQALGVSQKRLYRWRMAVVHAVAGRLGWQ